MRKSKWSIFFNKKKSTEDNKKEKPPKKVFSYLQQFLELLPVCWSH